MEFGAALFVKKNRTHCGKCVRNGRAQRSIKLSAKADTPIRASVTDARMGAMTTARLTIARAVTTVMSAAAAAVSIVVATMAAMTTMAAMHDGNAVVAVDRAAVAIVGSDDSAFVNGAST